MTRRRAAAVISGASSRLALMAALGAGLCLGCSLGAGADGAQGDGGAHGGDCTCELLLEPAQPLLGDTVHAQVNAVYGVSPFTYTWSVTFGAEDVSFSFPTAGSTQVDFVVARAGSYLVEVEQRTHYGYTCRAQRSLLVKNPTGKTEQVLLRFVPPAASGIPVQQQKLSITGGTPQTDLNLTLEAGITLDLDVGDGLGNTAPTFVRLIANDKGFETEAYLTAGAPLQITVLDDSYDVLVIPDETGTKRFAPTLSINQALSTLTPTNARLTLDPGVEVTGNVTAGGGAAVEGARVLLTRGRLPSTIGVVDQAGAFAVRVQSGTGFGVSVAPPEASGLPDLELADGLEVAALGADLTVAYDAALQPVNDLAAEIRTHDGSQVVAGARVTLRGSIGTAGTVKVGATSFDATGVVRRVATADGAGVVRFQSLPVGDYALVIEPLGHGLADDATTRATVTLPTSQVTVPLFRKVTLSGTLQRPAELTTAVIKDSRIKAILQVTGSAAPALGAAPTALVQDESGAFDVRVDPANAASPVRYALVADPPSGDRGMARAMRVVEVGGLEDVDLTPLALPRGLRLAGRVLPAYGAPLARVYVEAHRYRAAGQEDPAARAETYTDAEGRFTLLFCDPDDMP